MVSVDELEQIFTASNNAIYNRTEEAKAEFFRPAMEREIVKLWVQAPQLVKLMIAQQNPSVAKTANRMAQQYQEGKL